MPRLSGFDTGIRYNLPAGNSWNLSSVSTLSFWTYGDNKNSFGFQGNQPIVVLSSPGGSIRYEPRTQETANEAWFKHNIPLSGDTNWALTTTGTPSLSNITSLEIHQDTWDAGFTVYYDGLHFWNAGGLPPPGPPPPAGVNPDVISPRVLLYVFDPIMENRGGSRMHEVYGWADPVALTNQVASDLRTSSHGLVQYQIVDTDVVDAYPYFDDGYQQDDASFVNAWESAQRDFHPQAHFDYLRFARENNIAQRIDSGDLDEVWIYAPPIGGLWESAMGGKGAYWVNGPTQAVPSERAFVIMGWNFERGVGEAIHSFGHRTESVLDHIYGTQSPTLDTNWDKFAFQNRYAPGQGLGGVGNVHFPVNGISDYDYFNQTSVLSNADDWANYPNFKGTKRLINAREWSPNGTDAQREYLNWWYSHFPHFTGRGTDYYLANWWRYISDVDQFKTTSGNLYYATGIPSVQITYPSNGAHASGKVAITANAGVDGALGRVDLYVDGNYYATDSLSPFNFVWDASGLSGQHALVAKAYELQNGTESVSTVLSLEIDAAAVNHAPSFVAGDSVSATAENGGKAVAHWATSILPGPPDELAQSIHFVIVGNSAPNLFSVPPSVDSGGNLTFTPRPNAHGTAQVSVQLVDNGGTANGGVDRSAPQLFDIVVTKAHRLYNAVESGIRRGLDVTGSTTLAPDGSIVAGDVLAVINYINAKGSGHIPDNSPYGPPYCDVNGDDEVVAEDALKIINYLNAGNPSEGEATMPGQREASSLPSDLYSLLAMDVAEQAIRRRRLQ